MGLDILMLLISSGVLTEIIKWGIGKINLKLPPNTQPILAAALAELQTKVLTGGDVAGVPLPDFSQIPTIGALAAGLAATGLHQTAFAHKYIKAPDAGGSAPPTTIRSVYPFLLPLVLLVSGCSFFQHDVGPQVDIRMKTDQGCQSLVIMSQAIVEKKPILDPLGQESIVAQSAVQGVIRILGSECKG